MGFASKAWLNDGGHTFSSSGCSVGVTRTTLKGLLSLTCTPPWALHMGLQGDLNTQQDLVSSCAGMSTMLHVLDLGPRAHERLQAPHGWQDITRHTRQSTWSEDKGWDVGKSRQKQSARFLRDEGTVTVTEHPEAWQDVHALHLASRTRKGLAHHGNKLSALLNRLADQPWTFAVLALNEEGECVASGGFVVLQDQTCVYAFGGQLRSKVSGRASAAMLLAAMDEAKARGCTTFDFGGSQDPGVDQFYAEFGSRAVPMRRWVHAPWWFKFCFPQTWSAWTTPSPHF